MIRNLIQYQLSKQYRWRAQPNPTFSLSRLSNFPFALCLGLVRCGCALIPLRVNFSFIRSYRIGSSQTPHHVSFVARERHSTTYFGKGKPLKTKIFHQIIRILSTRWPSGGSGRRLLSSGCPIIRCHRVIPLKDAPTIQYIYGRSAHNLNLFRNARVCQ